MSFLSLAGKTAVVTGGARGIGRAICLRLAGLGVNVFFCSTNGGVEADATLDACRSAGKAAFIKADVSVFEDCKAMFEACEEAFGPPDILVNNAGITRDGLLARMSEEDFDRVLDVNLKGAFHLTKLAFRAMGKKRGGRIINITSVVGISGNAGQANYAASKAGLIGLTKTAAKEYAKRGITVNAIAPGFIETDMTAALTGELRDEMLRVIPLARFGGGEDVAACVAFLCSDEAAYITGQVIRVDGGMSI